MNDAMLAGTSDINLRPPSWTSSDNITDDALDGELLLDQLFQDSCNREFELPALS